MSSGDGGNLVRIELLDREAARLETPCGKGKLAWRRWGDGPPLMLLHGGFGSWLHWVRNIDALAQRFCVHAVDLPGLGASAPPPADYTTESVASIIRAGIDALLGRRERIFIGAFSLGAVISAPLIRDLGERVRHAVLLGAGGLGPMWHNALAQQRRRNSTMTEAELRELIRENLGASMIADRARIDDDTVSIQMRLLNQKRALIGLPMSHSKIVLDCLPRISARVTLRWGEHDPYLLPDVATVVARLRQDYPGVDAGVVADAGHWINYEQPDAVRAMFYRLIS